MVATLLSEKMRWKNTEGSNPKALSVRGRSINNQKGKPSSGDQSQGVSRSWGKCPYWVDEKVLGMPKS